MSKKFQAVKGTRDLLPPETAIWSGVEAVARRVFGTYGYREIRTPILEDTELFVRSVGESTDIVGKEMYTFDDRKGRSLTLRPENTASVVRAFVQHGPQSEPLPVKLFYIGPQFRYERPQKGRYRQFHQIGAELIGDPGPYSDAELILMLVRFLSELGFENLVVQLNTVGDEDSRAAYRLGLQEFLEPRRQELTPDSQRRLQTNPLRILDTKDPGERDLLVSAPQLVDYLTEESRTHFETVQRILGQNDLSFRVEPRLVRGLDYYTRTVFEIVSEGLGAQDAIVGGGRYDGLVEELGGPSLPAIGFAIGEDRLLGQTVIGGLGDAEVDDLRHGAAVVQRHHHVRRLEVAVNDALLVTVMNRVAHLGKQRKAGTNTQLVCGHKLGQWNALDQFHREVRLPACACIGGAGLIHAGNTGVLKSSEDLCFVREASY